MPHSVKSAKPADDDQVLVDFLLENALRDIGIPPCPAILNQITAEMAKDEPDLRHLDHFIRSDVSLASGLIAIANSPFFGLRRRVRSVNEALQMLGLGTAARAIAGLILRKLFPPTQSLQRFWHASAAIARLSGWLAQRAGAGILAEDAYTFGLFRDCGIPVLMRRYPHYPEVLKLANQERDRDFTAAEKSALPASHAEVGFALSSNWWLPGDICLAIAHHHDQRSLAAAGIVDLPPTALGLIATAQLAEHLFQHNTGLSQDLEWEKLGEACQRILNISIEDLPGLYEESIPVLASEE